MVNVLQLVLSLLPLSGFWDRPQSTLNVLHDAFVHDSVEPPPTEPTKSIAIVGAGSAGLGVLKAILDLPESIREDWEVVLYEQRRAVGGVWLPDPPGYHVEPPEVPETPLYPRLHTNTPHPTMTYPHFPFPPGTPLYPDWEAVLNYHVDFAAHYNLTPHINLNHTVVFAKWHAHDGTGDWHVEVHAQHGEDEDEVVIRRTFDHLIVANGHNHYPHYPTWDGTKGWLANSQQGKPARQILHSVYYREPEKFANLSVIVVGSGASGRDMAQQIEPLARVVYQSIRETKETAPDTTVTPKPPIAYLTNYSVIFEDGTELFDIDAILLGTGYEFRIPFLSSPQSSVLLTDPATSFNSSTAQTLTTNLRYIFPLYQHIFSLAPTVPPTALTFIGLPVLIANCPSDFAQGQIVAHALANASLLPSHDEMLNDLISRERSVSARGYDPYYEGHRLVDGDTEAQDYQDSLVDYLKKNGAIPDDGRKYVEPWRRASRSQAPLLLRAWKRAGKLGEQERWLAGIETEDEWADLMARLAEWQREWENTHPALVASTYSSPEWLYE
ncbi:dimethylaniline monooxygenase [Wolfiporia cocos MD-104 SS10]|uniref:Dimethylaniline monooxygenase n=1 Tax=Wolfiporia cocos (strain MD-104) TaxID=742152 RepID=A0A2H3JFP8_WOLCO|nr:dimethylaniline monooxygenase [Wolfiporia cocos MD-104 SS10]